MLKSEMTLKVEQSKNLHEQTALLFFCFFTYEFVLPFFGPSKVTKGNKNVLIGLLALDNNYFQIFTKLPHSPPQLIV